MIVSVNLDRYKCFPLPDFDIEPPGASWKGCQLIIHKWWLCSADSSRPKQWKAHPDIKNHVSKMCNDWQIKSQNSEHECKNLDPIKDFSLLQYCVLTAKDIFCLGLKTEMGVYRQLIRRPALPFLLIVSCLLISTPFWLTKQVDCQNISISRTITWMSSLT